MHLLLAVRRHNLLSDHNSMDDEHNTIPISVNRCRFGAPIESCLSYKAAETGVCEVICFPIGTADTSFSSLRKGHDTTWPTAERSKRDGIMIGDDTVIPIILPVRVSCVQQLDWTGLDWTGLSLKPTLCGCSENVK